MCMNARTDIDELAQIDAAEYDQIAIFNALGLKENEAAQLIASWEQCAPQSTLQDYARALVNGGAKLAATLDR